MHPAEKEAQDLHSLAYAKEDGGMVYQVWQDGEITLQKAGSLLWQRSLHQIVPPLKNYVAGLSLPCKSGDNSYAFVGSEADAYKVRKLLSIEGCPDIYAEIREQRKL